MIDTSDSVHIQAYFQAFKWCNYNIRNVNTITNYHMVHTYLHINNNIIISHSVVTWLYRHPTAFLLEGNMEL